MTGIEGRAKKRSKTRTCSQCQARDIPCTVVAEGGQCTNCRDANTQCSQQVYPKRRRTTSTTAAYVNESAGTNGNSQCSIRESEKVSVLLAALPAFIRPFRDRAGTLEEHFRQHTDVLILPPQSAQVNLINSYFDHVNPHMPLFDRTVILAQLSSSSRGSSDPDAGAGISLLLFQAMMFAGSGFVSSTTITAMGFESRAAARRALYMRAKHLYDLDLEHDRISLMQSVLLLTFWVEVEDPRGPWHWLGTAISLMQVIDLRGTLNNTSLRPQDIRTLRRLWWACFIRATYLSLGQRLPTRFKPEECDVPKLNLDDLGFSEPPRVDDNNSSDPQRFKEYTLAVISVELASLCVCLSQVLNIQAAVTTLAHSAFVIAQGSSEATAKIAIAFEIKRCSDQLKAWNTNLPNDARWPPPADKLEVTVDPTLDLHRILLRMTYFNTVNSLYRPQVFPSVQERQLSQQVNPEMLRHYRRKLFHATREVAHLAKKILSLNLLHLLPSYSISLVVTPLVIILIQIKMSSTAGIPDSLRSQYSGCMHVLEGLRRKYTCADRSAAYLDSALPGVSPSEPPVPIRDHSFSGQRTAAEVGVSDSAPVLTQSDENQRMAHATPQPSITSSSHNTPENPFITTLPAIDFDFFESSQNHDFLPGVEAYDSNGSDGGERYQQVSLNTDRPGDELVDFELPEHDVLALFGEANVSGDVLSMTTSSP